MSEYYIHSCLCMQYMWVPYIENVNGYKIGYSTNTAHLQKHVFVEKEKYLCEKKYFLYVHLRTA